MRKHISNTLLCGLLCIAASPTAFAVQGGPASDRAFAASLNSSQVSEGVAFVIPGFKSHRFKWKGDFDADISAEVWSNPTTQIFTYFYKIKPFAKQTGGAFIRFFGNPQNMTGLNYGWIPTESEGILFLPDQNTFAPLVQSFVFTPEFFSVGYFGADAGYSLTVFFQSLLGPERKILGDEFGREFGDGVFLKTAGRAFAP